MQAPAQNLQTELNQYQDLDLIVEENPQFSKAQFQWAIRHKKNNGMDELGVIVKFGKRLYLHRGRFAQWLDMQR